MSTQQDINAFRAQRLANTHDPLALMANTQTPFRPDHPSLITYLQHPQPNNNFVQKPLFNPNYMPQPMQNLEDSSDPTTAMNKTLALLAKAFKLNTIPTNNNQRNIKMQMVDDNVGNQVRQNAIQNDGNEYGNGNFVTTPAEGNGNGIKGNLIRCYNCRGEGHYASNCIVKPRKRDAAYLQHQLQIAQEGRKQDPKASTSILIWNHSDNAPSMTSYDATEEKEYAVLWNNWYTKCEECKYDKISYDKAYNDMQQKIKRLQAQLGDLKGKSCDTQCASNTLDPLFQKLEDEKVSLESQVLNYAKENAHLKTTYKNLFDSIKVTQAQTNSIIDSLQKQLYDTIYDNAKLRAQLFDKVSERKGTTKGTRTNTLFTKQSILGKPPSSSYKQKLYSVTPFPKSSVLPKVDKTNALSKPVTSNSAPSTRESKGVQTVKIITRSSKKKGSVRFSALYLKKKRNLLVFTSANLIVMTSMLSWKVYSSLFDRNINGENQFLKSSDVTTADAFDKRQQQQDSTSSTSSLATTIPADGNFDL
ncbi:gag-pol polyprotein [Tanacetum coccineum]|uniref:Gag-pol polyprotein n=1 Tax=Tanacetum coccineum TaxID=301880 RepID=A0ABQ5I7S9_9ASTR